MPVAIKSDAAYEGLLQFDIPRHRLFMRFTRDWPRMNAMPEWFTVEPDIEHKYVVEDADRNTKRVVTGKSLSQGLPVRVETGRPLRLIVRPE